MKKVESKQKEINIAKSKVKGEYSKERLQKYSELEKCCNMQKKGLDDLMKCNEKLSKEVKGLDLDENERILKLKTEVIIPDSLIIETPDDWKFLLKCMNKGPNY